jgi:hypothetical protein
MRKLILAAALVGVAVPALAQDREAWAERRAARAEQHQQAPRAEQGDQQARPERPRFEQRVEQPRAEQPRMEQPRAEQPRIEQPRAEQPRSEQAQLPQRTERPRIEWRQAHQGADEQQGSGQRDGRQWNGQRDGHQWTGRPRQVQPSFSQPATGQPPVVQLPGGQQWTGHQRDGQRWASRPAEQRWSSNWQRDPRYDWRRYRERNRSIFRVGSYYDPFGWGYRRVNIGFTLYSGYYSRNYWLDDPWQYRLPPVYGPYRWVRYFDDAVLVDVYSGQVVQVIRDFFW